MGINLKSSIYTYVDWPVSLLLVVGSDHVEGTGKFEKKVVLETEHRSRSNNGGLGEDAAHYLLSTALCSSSEIILPSHPTLSNVPWWNRILKRDWDPHCTRRRG